MVLQVVSCYLHDCSAQHAELVRKAWNADFGRGRRFVLHDLLNPKPSTNDLVCQVLLLSDPFLGGLDMLLK